MPRAPRADQFDPHAICIVHTIQRCVRRAYLAGHDAHTGKDYGPRRQWIRRRLEVLAAVFGIDVLTYAIMSNHMHLVLRTRPDVVQTWSDEEVARRWLRLFPGRRLDEYLGQPTVEDIRALAADSERIALIRTRLSDISWFMRSASEPIARMANREDDCTGRFWEGRFKAQRIRDEAGLLACAMYVDLNPVRAALAESPADSEHTSAYDRIKAAQGETVPSVAATQAPLTREQAAEEIKTTSVPARRRKAAQRRNPRQASTGTMQRDAWLAPLRLNERGHPSPRASRSGVRASDKGFLPMTVQAYLHLLDWTGRQGRPGKRGRIPPSVAPLLQQLGIEPTMWCDLVWNYRRYFSSSGSAGSPQRLREGAAESGRRWHRGQRLAEACFTGG